MLLKCPVIALRLQYSQSIEMDFCNTIPYDLSAHYIVGWVPEFGA